MPHPTPIARTAERSIIGDFIKILAAVFVVAAAVAPVVGNYISDAYVTADLSEKADTQLQQLLQVVRAPLWDYNQDAITIAGETFSQHDIIHHLKITDANGAVVFETGQETPTPFMTRSGAVEYKDQVIGFVSFEISQAYEESLKWKFFGLYLGSTAALMTFVLTFAGGFLRYLLGRTLKNFGQSVKAFSQGDETALRDEAKYMEFTPLVSALEDMKSTIDLQISQMKRMNQELESRVEDRTRELARQKEAAENYLAIAATIVVALDKNGRITLINDKGCEFLGYDRADILGRDWFDLAIPDDARDTVKAVFDRIISGDIEPFERYENEIVSADGERRLMSWHNSLVWGARAAITGVLSAGQDVTDERRTQMQLLQSAKMATLGEMATGIAHEINQPLNVIKMAVGNIQRRLGDGQLDNAYLSDKLDKVAAQIDRASIIIDHMRIFGRNSTIERSILSTEVVINDALSLMSEQLRLSGVEIETDVDAAAGLFMGHQVQVEQVLLNLLGNARDAMLHLPQGAPRRIAIRAFASPDRKAVVIEIEDSGGGIPKDALPKVFEPFFTTKDVGKGTGLGLSISYGIVADMGGAIRAENREHGACFIIEFPRTDR